MHQQISKLATENGYTLLPTQISDYFQIETSYIRKENDVIILLHVPCITHDQLLNIYRYVPFPFPLNKQFPVSPHSIEDALFTDLTDSPDKPTLFTTDALYLKPEAELIAIGPNSKFKILTQADIAHCRQRNKIYLCDKNHVLRTKLEHSCLGSLYIRSEIGVQQNCKFERRRLKEMVYQLNEIDHLVFSPEPLTVQMQCRNGSHFPIFLSTNSKISVPGGCEVTLRDHSIKSDYDINVSPNSLVFEWHWDITQLSYDLLTDSENLDIQFDNLRRKVALLQNSTMPMKSFDALLDQRFNSPSALPWPIIFSLVLSILSVLILVGWFLFNKYNMRRNHNEDVQTPRTHHIEMQGSSEKIDEATKI
jgi:hypothetical protein